MIRAIYEFLTCEKDDLNLDAHRLAKRLVYTFDSVDETNSNLYHQTPSTHGDPFVTDHVNMNALKTELVRIKRKDILHLIYQPELYRFIRRNGAHHIQVKNILTKAIVKRKQSLVDVRIDVPQLIENIEYGRNESPLEVLINTELSMVLPKGGKNRSHAMKFIARSLAYSYGSIQNLAKSIERYKAMDRQSNPTEKDIEDLKKHIMNRTKGNYEYPNYMSYVLCSLCQNQKGAKEMFEALANNGCYVL